MAATSGLEGSRLYIDGRGAADLDWSTDTPMNIASLSKVLMTVAVLQALANHNPALSINDKIAPFLPPDWAKA
jgi:CubicO group peptidase (beta-lactamase class C family)